MSAERSGTAFILMGLFIYGLHPVVVEFGGQFIAPLFFAGITATLAGITAIPVGLLFRSSGKTMATRNDYLRLGFAGIFGTFIAFTAFFLGLQLTTSNNAAIILRSELAFALLFGYFFLGETISLRQAIWIVVMVVGIILVVFTTAQVILGVGDFLLIVTPAAWAACHTLAKPTLERVSLWTVVAFRNLVGGFLLLLATFGLVVFGAPLIFTFTHSIISIVILTEAIVILLAHSLWYAGIRRINLGKATALIAPAPLVTFFFSILILRTVPTWWQLLGAVLVIIATFLLSREASLRRG